MNHTLRSFASDNNTGVHPEIFKALDKANEGHTIAYGDDPFTHEAELQFKKLFGKDTEVFFVFTGTAANVLSLSQIANPFHAIICAETAHINIDECGAPERFTGSKLIDIPTRNGKLSPQLIVPFLQSFGFEHHVQPKIISISQASELGTVYGSEEIKALAELAHSNNMFLHIDGARIANAAVSLNLPIVEFTKKCGVDVLTFGGTKNGMMFGEAIVFLNKSLAENFKYIRKQGMQLYSKMRFIAAQFIAYLKDDLWLSLASHANYMAQKLEKGLSEIEQIKITQPVEANGIFAIIPKNIISNLQKDYFFYVWNENTSEVRWMCSWDTTEDDIKGFIKVIKNKLNHA